MTDQHLLEAAARAAGLDAGPKYDDHFGLQVDDDSPLGYRWWNPLTDDGDALRLAVRLRMVVSVRGTEAVATHWPTPSTRVQATERCAKHGDIEAATRRAIVRCAAPPYPATLAELAQADRELGLDQDASAEASARSRP